MRSTVVGTPRISFNGAPNDEAIDGRNPRSLPREIGLATAHLLGVALIGGVDYALGSDIQLSAVYLVPIISSASVSGRTTTILTALTAALAWFLNTAVARAVTPNLAILAFDALSRLAIFLTLAVVVIRLREGRNRMQLIARTDDLTGLANARELRLQLQAEIARAQRYARTTALLLIDCDGFKTVNDRFGHAEGDRVLGEIGSTLARLLRAPDLAVRWGGDEFAVLQPEGTPDGAIIVADRISAAIRELDLSAPNGHPLRMTVSIGIAAYPQIASDADGLFRAADHALYEAKRAGKDRVVAAGSVRDTTPG